jgi:hypothetical protein
MTLHNLHVLAVFCAVFAIAVADHEVFGWILGRKQTLSRTKMHYVHWAVWGTLLTLIGSGILLFLPRYDYLLRQPLFDTKLLFVCVLVMNAVVIGNLMEMTLTYPYASVPFKEKLPLLVSGAVSSISWSSVILIGLYLFYPWYTWFSQ